MPDMMTQRDVNREARAHAATRARFPTITNDVYCLARSLMNGIAAELPEVESFTREDLLHLRVFQHVATISRYRYVCLAVQELLTEGKLVSRGRTTLVLASKARAFDRATSGLALWDRYWPTIERQITQQRGEFAVIDVVNAWARTDQHLTINSKRVAVRDAIRYALREQLIEQTSPYTYRALRP